MHWNANRVERAGERWRSVIKLQKNKFIARMRGVQYSSGDCYNVWAKFSRDADRKQLFFSERGKERKNHEETARVIVTRFPVMLSVDVHC